MSERMPMALTIAGFDGSAGAGLLADVKTMAYFGVYGQAVCTSLTEQNEDEFVTPGWVAWERIEAQLDVLFRRRSFRFVKIGLVENAGVLRRIVEFLREKSSDVFVIWDPIASATAGFQFVQEAEREKFIPLMKKIDLVTPNQEEFGFFGLDVAAARGELEFGKDFNLLLKGGHGSGPESVDTLWYGGAQYKFSSPRIPGAGKHGTGCNLSSAILANVALGRPLPEACRIAKDYMGRFIQSGDGRLGFVR